MLKISMLKYLGGSALMFAHRNLPKRQDGAVKGRGNLGGGATKQPSAQITPECQFSTAFSHNT